MLGCILIILSPFILVGLMFGIENVVMAIDKREFYKFKKIITPPICVQMIEPNKNPFTDRTNILVITDVKAGWVRVNNNGLLDDYKIEDFYSKLKRYVRFKQCTGWYIKDRMDNILLIIK